MSELLLGECNGLVESTRSVQSQRSRRTPWCVSRVAQVRKAVRERLGGSEGIIEATLGDQQLELAAKPVSRRIAAIAGIGRTLQRAPRRDQVPLLPQHGREDRIGVQPAGRS